MHERPSFWRQIWYFALVALVMNSTLVVAYGEVTFALARRVASTNSAWAELFKSTYERLENSSEAFRGETQMQEVLNQLAPILAKVDWFEVTALTSVLAFSLFGLFYVRLTGKLEWAGALPLVAVLGGQSPPMLTMGLAQQGIAAAELSFPKQSLVVAIQLATVYFFGAVGWLLYRRRHRDDLPLE